MLGVFYYTFVLVVDFPGLQSVLLRCFHSACSHSALTALSCSPSDSLLFSNSPSFSLSSAFPSLFTAPPLSPLSFVTSCLPTSLSALSNIHHPSIFLFCGIILWMSVKKSPLGSEGMCLWRGHHAMQVAWNINLLCSSVRQTWACCSGCCVILRCLFTITALTVHACSAGVLVEKNRT